MREISINSSINTSSLILFTVKNLLLTVLPRANVKIQYSSEFENVDIGHSSSNRYLIQDTNAIEAGDVIQFKAVFPV